MKNKLYIVSVLAGILLLLLTGCSVKQNRPRAEYHIFYPDRQYNRLVSVECTDEIQKREDDVSGQVDFLLEELKRSSENGDYMPTVAEFEVLDYRVENERVTINVSDSYAALDPVREVLIRAALVKTVTQLDSVVFVTIQVNGSNLLDSLGEPVGMMNENTFIDNTGVSMKNYEETEISLYFANETGDKLIKVNRKLMYNTNTSKEKLVVEQLIRGPLNQSGNSVIPVYATLNPEIGIISVNVRDGICYVNLDENFLISVYTANADTVIYSLVNSLTELPEVRKVQLAVEGETDVLYRKQYDLSTFFEANPNLVQTVEGGV